MWNSIVKPAVVLFVVCLVISGSLAFINGMTKDIIEENTRLEQEGFRKQVLTAADRFLQIEPEGIPEAIDSVYEGFRGNESIGFIMEITTKGYGGDVSMTVGINSEGQITGVVVGANNETPGLGSKATGQEFLVQFAGIQLAEVMEDALVVVKQNTNKANEIQAVAGATISSRSITDGVQAALDTAAIIRGGD
jgi:electron transport complex protein RnfG